MNLVTTIQGLSHRKYCLDIRTTMADKIRDNGIREVSIEPFIMPKGVAAITQSNTDTITPTLKIYAC